MHVTSGVFALVTPLRNPDPAASRHLAYFVQAAWLDGNLSLRSRVPESSWQPSRSNEVKRQLRETIGVSDAHGELLRIGIGPQQRTLPARMKGKRRRVVIFRANYY
jgi:hypothetical protein